MDFIWSPWRYDYLASHGDRRPTCVFCIGEDPSRDAERLVVLRAEHNFIILNLFPYTSGHLMIAPYEHRNTIEGALETAGQALLAALKPVLDAYVAAWIDDIDAGLAAWPELGLATTLALFDPQTRRFH